MPSPSLQAEPVLAICLCAAWCTACREYRALFDRAAQAFDVRARFVWVDIEDDAALLDGIDVENFPTLMLSRGDVPLFFGTVMPHAETLRRLIERSLAGDLPPLQIAPSHAPEMAALPSRLRPSRSRDSQR